MTDLCHRRGLEAAWRGTVGCSREEVLGFGIGKAIARAVGSPAVLVQGLSTFAVVSWQQRNHLGGRRNYHFEDSLVVGSCWHQR